MEKAEKIVKEEEKLHCRDCRFYREEIKECVYGGGFGWYSKPDDECELGFTKTWYNEKNEF